MAPRSPGPPGWVTRGSAPWVPYLRRKWFCRMAFRRPCGSEGGAEVRFERASCPFGSAHPGVLAGRPTLKGPCALAPADQCPGIMKAISPWGDVAVNSGFPGRRRTGAHAHPGGLCSGGFGRRRVGRDTARGVALAVPARQPLPGWGRRTPGPGSFWPAGGNDEPSTNGCGQRRSAR